MWAHLRHTKNIKRQIALSIQIGVGMLHLAYGVLNMFENIYSEFICVT
jgi:hypothetical protein